jgi:EspA-like secreted protein
VGMLDGFLSTWSGARNAFGEGAPQQGSEFDGSGKLRQLQADLDSAAPDSRWTGTASTAYGNANHEHGRVLGQLAGLDQRLASEVTASATVVATGRRDLEAVRKWVLDAASAVPQNRAGERMMLPIVQKGLNDLTGIVHRSNSGLNAIGSRIRAIGDEYQALGNQRFARQNGESATGDSRKPKAQTVDFRQSPAPEEPPPPDPGGGYGSYHYGYQFSTSEAWSQKQIMQEIQNKYNKYFTFTGDQPKIAQGAVINLNGPAGPEPVKVTKVTDTSFSFVSLPGHHEGAGRVVEFSVVPAAASPVPGRLNWELRVEASGPISGLSVVPGASWFDKGVWQVFADNLESRLPVSPPGSGGTAV